MLAAVVAPERRLNWLPVGNGLSALITLAPVILQRAEGRAAERAVAPLAVQAAALARKRGG